MDSRVSGWLDPVFQPGGPKALSHIQPGCLEDFDFNPYSYVLRLKEGRDGSGWGGGEGEGRYN